MKAIVKILTAVLLATVFLLPLFGARNFSAASDEVTHLPSGYSYWRTGLIQLNTQHPPLAKLLAAFPLLFMDLKFDRWNSYLASPLKDEWKFGSDFLFSNDADKILFWGRLPMMLISLLLGFYIFRWASEMFNSKASGLLALFFYAFMPVVIANAQFVATDLPVTAFSFIALYYLWKYFGAKQWKFLIFAGLFLGAALASKFSAVVLLPVVFVLILICLWPEKSCWEEKLGRTLKILFILFGLSFAVVYISYLLPLDASFYLRGLKSIYADWGTSYKFYLNGEFSSEGWWYYFLYAFLVKTPVPSLAALGIAFVRLKKYRLSFQNLAFIFIPVLFFGFVTSWKAGNIGIRYLLPIYPFLILFAGGCVSRILNFKIIGTLVLTVWYVFSAVNIYPDYMAYFNEFVGGPKNGYKHLDDSNLEWGQDLKRLAVYQEKHPETKVLYSWDYIDPAYYGLKNVLPKKPESLLKPSGRYAVNAHLLARLKELSQMYNDESLNWQLLYKSTGRVGYSFFIYEF